MKIGLVRWLERASCRWSSASFFPFASSSAFFFPASSSAFYFAGSSAFLFFAAYSFAFSYPLFSAGLYHCLCLLIPPLLLAPVYYRPLCLVRDFRPRLWVLVSCPLLWVVQCSCLPLSSPSLFVLAEWSEQVHHASGISAHMGLALHPIHQRTITIYLLTVGLTTLHPIRLRLIML